MANLHEYALAAESNLEKLATGLAQAGVDEGTVGAVTQMADATRKIVKALGKGQEATGDEEAPAPEEPAEESAPPQSFDEASKTMPLPGR